MNTNYGFPATSANVPMPKCKPPRVNKYPAYILETLRQRLGLDENDTSRDEEFSNISPNRVFSEVTKWDGLLGSYDAQIKDWVKDIYGIDLNEIGG